MAFSYQGACLPCSGPGSYPARVDLRSHRRAALRGRRQPAHRLRRLLRHRVRGTRRRAFGLAEYNPARNLLGPVTRVFSSGFGTSLAAAARARLSGLRARDGYLYLFGFCQVASPLAGCGASQVFLARTVARPAYWGNPFTYQYWTGDGWSAQAGAAGSLIPAGHLLGISVGDYAADGQGPGDDRADEPGRRLPGLAGQGRRPARGVGLLAGRVPCTRGIEAGTEGLCRALIGHPELSTRGDLLISYYDPGKWPRAHGRLPVARVT